MPSLKKIHKKIKEQEIIEHLIEAINLYTPSYQEAPIISQFVNILQDEGVAVQLQAVPDPQGQQNRANIIVNLGPPPPKLLWVGHLDTVKLWYDTDHEARPVNERIYGLGSSDMKGGCVAALQTILALHRSGVNLQEGVAFAFVVGEEEEGDGATELMKSVQAPYTVIGEPSSLRPCLSYYSYMEVLLSSQGNRAHAAMPEVGDNAIQAHLKWMLEILERSKNLQKKSQLAINPREIQGGRSDFAVADSCEAVLDFHFSPKIKKEEISQIIKKSKKVAARSYPRINLKNQITWWSPGYLLNEKNLQDKHLIQHLQHAYQINNITWKPDIFRSHSDADILHQSGTAPVILGPGNLASAHRRDEFVDKDQVIQAAYIYTSLVHSMCS